MERKIAKQREAREILGMTLIEAIIYVALTSIIMVVLVNVGLSVMRVGARVDESAELTYHGTIVLNQLSRTMKNGAIASGASVFNQHPALLVIENGVLIQFLTNTQQVMVGSMPRQIRTLFLKRGSGNPEALTSNRIDVTNFVVKNRTRGSEPESIKIELTLTAIESNKTLSFHTAIAKRQP